MELHGASIPTMIIFNVCQGTTITKAAKLSHRNGRTFLGPEQGMIGPKVDR